MGVNAEVLLIRDDGSVILQIRDDKPGITNPGLVSSFGGHIEPGEQPVDAAIRELGEETNLKLRRQQLEFYRKCRKTRDIHGEDWDVYYFAAQHISEIDLEVYEGTGYTIIHNKEELLSTKTSLLLKQVLTDYFDGFGSFLFQADIPDAVKKKLFDEHYNSITRGKQSTHSSKPIALACTGLVASGKSSLTTPLANSIDAVGVSSDRIREIFFRAGYNFKQVRPFINQLLDKLAANHFNIFLDFNISTNMPILAKLSEQSYYPFVVYANPPERFIKHKILTGEMKHELTFYPKDEFLYVSMLAWKDEHAVKLPELREQYGIWREIDTSRKDLPEIMRTMLQDFKQAVSQL